MTTLNDPMVDRLVKRRDQALGQIDALKQAALDGDRDLTETDSEAIGEYKRQIGDIDKQLELVGDNLRMDDDARARLAQIAPSAKPSPLYRNDGELIYDLLHQSEADSHARYRSTLKRAAEHMGTDAADTVDVAGDLKALYVSPKVGPVVRVDNDSMPFATALGVRSMPAGSSFERPFIVDADFDDGVAEQGLEKAELASEMFTADVDMLKRTTIGGYLNISAQTLAWQPGSLQIIVDQMRARLASKIESYYVTAASASTSSVTLAADADAGTTLKAIYAASAAVFSATNSLASWILMGPDGWARLGGLTDAAGRPMFPTLSPSNAAGQASAAGSITTVAGLTPIVSPKVTGANFLVGNSAVVEAYAYYYPLLEAVEPSVLGRQIAVAADVVAHTPTPYANSAVHLQP